MLVRFLCVDHMSNFLTGKYKDAIEKEKEEMITRITSLDTENRELT